MELSNAQRAEVLIHALPYIQNYYNKIVVVKYGGSAMQNEDIKNAVMGDIVLLSLIGIKVVLVHGGGPEITKQLEIEGKKSEFVDGLRVTDSETAEIVQMVLCGKVNKSLVAKLQKLGGSAVGLCGIDGGLIQAESMDERLGFVGDVKNVNAKIILDTLNNGYIPVISTVGADKSGNIYNINADTAAAHIAGALEAESLISMTDTCGILRKSDDPKSLISEINIEEAKALIADGTVSAGMIPKVECCISALNMGVKKVFIIDGRIPHSIIVETLTDEGIGTMFLK